MTTTTDTPRAWIGCLACYNEGKLMGRWFDAIDCPQDMDDFNDRVTEFPSNHVSFGHEELWVMDHENFDGLLTGECSPADAQELAELITNLQERDIDVEAYAAYREYVGKDYATLDEFEEAYNGHWESEGDFAENLAEDIGALREPLEWPFTYIDWERAARELFMSDYWSTRAPGGGVYVFRNV